MRENLVVEQRGERLPASLLGCLGLLWLLVAMPLWAPAIAAAGSGGASYSSIDAHARQAPEKVAQNVPDLARYLTAPAANEREKARAIFTWIATHVSYDVEAFRSGRLGDLSADAVLKSRRSVCSGYAALFQALAAAAGLEAVTVHGYSKGYGYMAGESFGTTNHAWNAVRIDKQWRLLDSTWGAGYLDDSGRFVRRFTEHFFLTAPVDFIYDHLPAEPRWQLLANPISMRQFQELVYVKSTFFLAGLKIVSHPSATIKSGPELEVVLKGPADTLLLATLLTGDRRLDEGATLVQRRGEEFVIQAVLPAAGEYVLRLFAKSRNEPGSYGWALDYRLSADRGSGAGAGFPQVFAGFGEEHGYLYSPLRGRLKAGHSHPFRIKLPGAEQVAVKAGEHWQDLRRQGDLFVGQVLVARGTIQVLGRFPGKEQYRGLLQYTGY